jgi:hypothetical protein
LQGVLLLFLVVLGEGGLEDGAAVLGQGTMASSAVICPTAKSDEAEFPG